MNLKINKNISYLIGNEEILINPLTPYHHLTCTFLDELSSTLIHDKKAQGYPDVISFAFWCRKANISKLKNNFVSKELRLGLGLVFHITPSNIPVNFAFSFAFGLLSGNSNIVRVPSKDFEQTKIICEALNKTLNHKKYNILKKMTSFISYKKDNEITSFFSQKCNGRIIWGGDKTIYNIKLLPASARCVDIAFANRFSFAIINANAVLKTNVRELERLIEGFYNDTYLMDQNACSSPHLIIWTGKNKKEAKKLFWDSLYKKVKQKYKLTEITAIDKYVHLCENIINLDIIKEFYNYENLLYILNLSTLNKNLESYHGKFGSFFEYETDNLKELVPIVNNKYQTLTYFGMNNILLAEFVMNNSLLGIDRIVPIGQALDINVVWDGYNLISKLSRIIDVK